MVETAVEIKLNMGIAHYVNAWMKKKINMNSLVREYFLKKHIRYVLKMIFVISKYFLKINGTVCVVKCMMDIVIKSREKQIAGM